MEMSGAGASFSMDADFAFQLPGAMYMSMRMSGDDGSGIDLGELGSIDMLVRDDTLYMKTILFGDDWVAAPLDGMGAESALFEDMLSEASAFDYRHLVESLEGVEFAGEETVDGREMLHYTLTLDAADAVSALAGALDSSGSEVTETLDGVSGPISIGLWLGKSDFLPYLMEMDMDVTSASEGSMSLQMTMQITGYNTEVDIPAVPEDAVPIEDVFGDMFGGLAEGQ
jgi:hypothetical protein